jgi:Ni,Fe-hydrogenase I cytochrome b subunit
VGNGHAKQLFLPPLFNKIWWQEVYHELRWYAFYPILKLSLANPQKKQLKGCSADTLLIKLNFKGFT